MNPIASKPLVGLEGLNVADLEGFEVQRLEELTSPLRSGTDLVGITAARLWLVDEEAGPVEYAVRAAAAAGGDTMLVVPGDDLRALDEGDAGVVRRLDGVDEVHVGLTEHAAWQLNIVRAGMELPGGEQILFPERRLIALYGHPGAPVLGALGEQVVVRLAGKHVDRFGQHARALDVRLRGL